MSKGANEMRRADAENGSSPSSHVSTHRVIRWLTVLGMSAALGILALGWMILFDARNDAWQQAEQASSNLATALEQDISRHITLYDLSIRGVGQAMELPGINQ